MISLFGTLLLSWRPTNAIARVLASRAYSKELVYTSEMSGKRSKCDIHWVHGGRTKGDRSEGLLYTRQDEATGGAMLEPEAMCWSILVSLNSIEGSAVLHLRRSFDQFSNTVTY